MTTTTLDLTAIHAQASLAAETAAREYFINKLGGVDRFACGFAWVRIEQRIRANSKLGKQLESLGFDKGYTSKCFELWNPSRLHVQNVDTLEAGAQAYAKVLRDNGIEAYACSRLD
jgi:DNA-directed RNA polymerase subunit N (RpoN/RPB10)